MEKIGLRHALERVTARRKDRMTVAKLVLYGHFALSDLLELVFRTEDPVSVKASWVLDFVTDLDCALLFPYLEGFTKGVGMVEDESALRPLARTTEKLLKALDVSNDSTVPGLLDGSQREQLTAAAFSWLIGPHRVASKVYAMGCLYYLGKTVPWVHNELQQVLEQQYAGGSAGFKARARDTLKKLRPFKGGDRA